VEPKSFPFRFDCYCNYKFLSLFEFGT